MSVVPLERQVSRTDMARADLVVSVDGQVLKCRYVPAHAFRRVLVIDRADPAFRSPSALDPDARDVATHRTLASLHLLQARIELALAGDGPLTVSDARLLRDIEAFMGRRRPARVGIDG